MEKEKLLIIVLVVLAIGGLAWSAGRFFSGSNSSKSLVDNTPENFSQAVQSELPDKCDTPGGYTDEQWLEHMSHHPDRYQECLDSVDPADLVKHIGPGDLSAMLENKDFSLVDVHIPEQAHIPSTDSFIPFNEIQDYLSRLPQDKNEKIVLYCRSGSMSRIASEELIELGYAEVYNLVGGLNGWQQMGYEVEEVSLQ